jgi:cell division protease FtsH
MKPTYNFYPQTNITFDDVAGCDGAKLELAEVVDFLKNPIAYTENGCIIPKGVLLYGPPGTGKTLLAKAVAGEACVPFVSISGSEFVELYVGVGASRVRELFSQAKKNAPCIVFLDEIDAVGRQRGAGYAGGNDEREQTINQILVEMDGFEGNIGVITLAATNRLDILDEALLRPGRFDRKVAVDLPDVGGRRRILGVHARGKPLESDVDLDAVARRTPGFSGAELENLMNEGALSAARNGKTTIGWVELDGALDRLMVGMEKRGGTTYLSQEQKELVAYHEAGHAIVGSVIPDYDNVQKVTIVPRSNGAGGLTFFSPQESRLESGMYSKQYLESQLVVALGGRVAEEIIFGQDKVTTGATNDLDHVAGIAKKMVKEFGMSEAVGPVALTSPNQDAPFMGRSLGLPKRNVWGSKMLSTVDSEVERLVNNAYVKAKAILTNNIELLHHLAYKLVEQEIVTAEELQYMMLKFDAKMVEYKVMGVEKFRDKLPFQDLPKDV